MLTLPAGTASDASSGTGTVAAGDDAGHGHAAAVEESPVGFALVVAILAFLTGIAGVVLGWRADRRTVCP